MTTELALRKDTDMDLMTLGKVLAQSGYFKETRDAAQAIVKVLAGRELGLGPIASMRGISLVMGNVTLNASLIASLIKSSKKYNYKLIEHTETRCELAFFENGQEVGRSSFSMDDAKKAGLAGKDLWQKYPRNLLFARAISNGAKWFCGEVFNGPIYTPDEFGDDAPAQLVDTQTSALPEQAASYEQPQEKDLDEMTVIGTATGIRSYITNDKPRLGFVIDDTRCVVSDAGLIADYGTMQDGAPIEVVGTMHNDSRGRPYLSVLAITPQAGAGIEAEYDAIDAEQVPA